MSFVRRPRLLASAAFRLSLLFAVLFLVGTAALLAVVFNLATRQLDAEIDDSIAAEARALLAIYSQVGPVEFVHLVQVRAAGDPRAEVLVVLQTTEGRRIAGHPLRLPVALTGWWSIEIQPEMEGGLERPARLFGVLLPGGLNLVLVRDLRGVQRATRALLLAVLVAGAAAIALALVTGLIAARRFGRRVEVLSRACRRIMDGNLDERLAVSGAGDEFDRLAESVNAMLDRIALLMQGLKQVSSDIAHDLRTPIARLRQRLEATRAQAADGSKHADALDDALSETDSVMATFAALLRIAQVEAKARHAGFAEIDLAATLRSLVETYQAVAEEQGHQLIATLPVTCPMNGDADLLAQMVANLIENSYRHAGPRAHVALTLACDPVEVRIAVADRGPGIPAADRKRVLDRFVRLESSRSAPGSGLGLSLVSAIVRLHSGRIELDDAAPGLRVTVALPRDASRKITSDRSPTGPS